MATGWAVGSSAALALAAVGILSFEAGALPFALRELALVAALACWAYAIAQGAYGRKGALVALLAYDLALALGAAGVLPLLRARGAPTIDITPVALAGLALVVSLLAAWAIVAELRARRGPVQWATALGLCAPLLVALPAALL